jgi:hypothetical protein
MHYSGEQMKYLINLMPVLVSLLITVSGVAEEYPLNSVGPAAIVMSAFTFGLSYERAVSHYFCLNAVASTSGDVDFGGVRLMLSRNDTALHFRPSIGFCMGRSRSSDEPSSYKSPWMGLFWPGIGINARSHRISTSIDLSACYNAKTGSSFEDNHLTISATIMYMF